MKGDTRVKKAEYECNFGIVHMMITAHFYTGGALECYTDNNGVDYIIFYNERTGKNECNRISLTDLGLNRSDFINAMQLPLMW